MKNINLFAVAALGLATILLAHSALAQDGIVYEGPAYQAPGYHGAADYAGAGHDGVVYEGGGHPGAFYGGPMPCPPGMGGYGGYGQASWHSGYYHVMWGKPLALVVPPTLTHQTNWGWGVGNTRVTPIYPQFVGPLNATGYSSNERFRPTPYYVSDTLQFGVYYIRGPW